MHEPDINCTQQPFFIAVTALQNVSKHVFSYLDRELSKRGLQIYIRI